MIEDFIKNNLDKNSVSVFWDGIEIPGFLNIKDLVVDYHPQIVRGVLFYWEHFSRRFSEPETTIIFEYDIKSLNFFSDFRFLGQKKECTICLKNESVNESIIATECTCDKFNVECNKKITVIVFAKGDVHKKELEIMDKNFDKKDAATEAEDRLTRSIMEVYEDVRKLAKICIIKDKKIKPGTIYYDKNISLIVSKSSSGELRFFSACIYISFDIYTEIFRRMTEKERFSSFYPPEEREEPVDTSFYEMPYGKVSIIDERNILLKLAC